VFYDNAQPAPPPVVPESEAGYGTVGSQSVYYDTNPDGSTNVFPDGRPQDRHAKSPHEHLVVNEDGGVEYWRTKEGEELNNYRDFRHRD